MMSTSGLAMRFFLINAAVCWALFFCGFASLARGDTVTLKDGSVYDGTVIRESSREVTIKCATGTFSFSRGSVKSVSRSSESPSSPALEPKPQSPAAPEPRADGSSSTRPSPRSKSKAKITEQSPQPVWSEEQDAQSEPPARDGGKSRSASEKAKLESLLSELEKNSLQVWENESSERVTDGASARYRFQDPSGVLGFGNDKPASPHGLAKLWVQEQCTAGSDVVFINCTQWTRLYWDEEKSDWTRTDPKYSRFSMENAKVRTILEGLAGRGSKATNIAVTAGVMERLDPSSSEYRERDAKLKELAQQAGQGWSGGDLLYQAFLLSVKIHQAPAPAEKISLAQERRELARRLVSQFPGN